MPEGSPYGGPAIHHKENVTLTRMKFFAAVAMLGLALPATAQTNNPDFRLTNRGQQAINEIYVSSSSVSGWGNDRLGRNVLAPGAGFNVVLPAGQCVNDIRVIWADGSNVERRQVNTCNLTDVSFP